MSADEILPSLHAALLRAQALLDDHRTDDALGASAHLLIRFPDAVRVWRLRAAALQAAGRAADAAAAFMRVLDVTPDDAAALTGCARALHNSGRSLDAADIEHLARDYRSVSTEDLLDVDDAHIDDGRIFVARQLFAAELVNRAYAHVRGILEEQPTRPDALVVLMMQLWHSGVRHVAAELARSLLADHPNCLAAHAVLTAFAARTGDDAARRIHADAVSAFDPDHREIAALFGADAPLPVVEGEVDETTEEETIDDRRQTTTNEATADDEPPTTTDEVTTDDGPTTTDEATADDERATTKEETSEEPTAAEEEPELIHPPWMEEIVAEAANRARMEPNTVEEPDPLDWTTLDHEPPLVAPPSVTARSNSGPPRVTDEGITMEPLDWSSDEEDLIAPPIRPEPRVETPKPRKAAKKSRSGKSKSEDMLQSARIALAEGDVDAAAELYDGLIAKGKQLDDVIDDLDAAVLTVPNARRLYELLGQAHTRRGNIPAALEAFRKAMRGE